MRIWPIIALLLLPTLASAICQPEEGMSKKEVYDLCGPPDYTEIVYGQIRETAMPLTTGDAELLEGEQTMVLWQYDLFEGEASRIILFHKGRVVKCCLPEID